MLFVVSLYFIKIKIKQLIARDKERKRLGLRHFAVDHDGQRSRMFSTAKVNSFREDVFGQPLTIEPVPDRNRTVLMILDVSNERNDRLKFARVDRMIRDLRKSIHRTRLQLQVQIDKENA
jgi:hypothetical protein